MKCLIWHHNYKFLLKNGEVLASKTTIMDDIDLNSINTITVIDQIAFQTKFSYT